MCAGGITHQVVSADADRQRRRAARNWRVILRLSAATTIRVSGNAEGSRRPAPDEDFVDRLIVILVVIAGVARRSHPPTALVRQAFRDRSRRRSPTSRVTGRILHHSTRSSWLWRAPNAAISFSRRSRWASSLFHLGTTGFIPFTNSLVLPLPRDRSQSGTALRSLPRHQPSLQGHDPKWKPLVPPLRGLDRLVDDDREVELFAARRLEGPTRERRRHRRVPEPGGPPASAPVGYRSTPMSWYWPCNRLMISGAEYGMTSSAVGCRRDGVLQKRSPPRAVTSRASAAITDTVRGTNPISAHGHHTCSSAIDRLSTGTTPPVVTGAETVDVGQWREVLKQSLAWSC